MKTFNELFRHQVKDIYAAEKQLTDAIPKVIDAVNDKRLRNTLESHLDETRMHMEKIRSICGELDVNPGNMICEAMRGIILECEHMAGEEGDPDVRDAGIIACMQRVEHYEISAYGTAVRYARELNHEEIASQLQAILDQEYHADQLLDDLAEGRINKMAIKN